MGHSTLWVLQVYFHALLSLVTEYFYTAVELLLLKNLCTSSTTADCQQQQRQGTIRSITRRLWTKQTHINDLYESIRAETWFLIQRATNCTRRARPVTLPVAARMKADWHVYLIEKKKGGEWGGKLRRVSCSHKWESWCMKWEQMNMCLLVKGFAPVVPPESRVTACKRPRLDSSEFPAVESSAERGGGGTALRH